MYIRRGPLWGGGQSPHAWGVCVGSYAGEWKESLEWKGGHVPMEGSRSTAQKIKQDRLKRAAVLLFVIQMVSAQTPFLTTEIKICVPKAFGI